MKDCVVMKEHLSIKCNFSKITETLCVVHTHRRTNKIPVLLALRVMGDVTLDHSGNCYLITSL